MYSKLSLFNAKVDMIKVVFTITVSHLLHKAINSNVKLFNNTILIQMISTAIGYLTYNLLTAKLLTLHKFSDEHINRIIKVFVRFGTVFIVLQSIITSLDDYEPDYPPEWIYSTLYILLGFSLYNGFISHYVHKKIERKSIDDVLRVSFGLLTRKILENQEFNYKFFLDSGIKMIGLILFNEFALPRIK